MDDSPSFDAADKDGECDLDSLYDGIKEHDDIRFATYRTAAKIRYVQRKGFLHHIDIWNIIEAFRENGLNTMEATTLVNRARLETLLSSLYSNLNKRLPPGQNIDVDKTSNLMSTWLLFSLCSDQTNRLKVVSVKIALSVLCCGKLMDKLRFIFSQLTECNGQLIHARFHHFIAEICKLPAAVGEGRTFSVAESSQEIIFPPDAKVTVNDFLEMMMSDPGPHCVSWLLVLHRISAAESNFHPVGCAGCGREGFSGLRYKSDSANYHLCQLCFWRGDMSDEHKDDVFKEYSAWKTPGKPSGLRRSIRCVPPQQQQGPTHRLPRFPDKPEPPLDLANIVPASPLPTHNGFNQQQHPGPGSAPPTRRMSPALTGIDKLAMTRLHGSSPQPARRLNSHPQNQLSKGQLPHQMNQFNQFATLPQPRLNSTNMDKSSHRGNKADEHELIACYASHLADQSSLDYLGLATGGMRSRSSPEDDNSFSQRRDRGPEKDSRRLVYELEKKNAEIMREIARLRQNRASVQDMEKDPNVVTELEVLRQRKSELESRLMDLQETRKDLMIELEELMKILRVQGNPGNVRNEPAIAYPPMRHIGQHAQQPHQQDLSVGGHLPGLAVANRQDDLVRGKSFQACKFSQVTKHQNVSAKLRPLPTDGSSHHPYGGGGGLHTQQHYPHYEDNDIINGTQRCQRNGDTGGGAGVGGNGHQTGDDAREVATTISSPDDTSSVPASVNSLSE